MKEKLGTRMKPQITMLNAMAGRSFHDALDQFKSWGLQVVDLKNSIYDKSIEQLTSEEAEIAAHALHKRGLSAYCFSTELFHDCVEKGEAYFRKQYLSRLDHILRTAEILRPTVIRLLTAKFCERASITDTMVYVQENVPWLINIYREAIDAIHAAGFTATIENECSESIFANPDEITVFFRLLDRPNKVHFTYDVQNLWQMGTYPSVEVYHQLKPLIGFLHLKGGQYGDEGTSLQWKSALEDASWPVAEMTKLAVLDGVSPVICLNPSHGKLKEGYSYEHIVQRDLDFVKSLIATV
jgi:hypothetical protein